MKQSRDTITLAQLARGLQLPYSTLHQKYVAGELVPDVVVGRFILFYADRIGEVKRHLRPLIQLQRQKTFRPKIAEVPSSVGRVNHDTRLPWAVSA